jgi:hypothetical protein
MMPSAPGATPARRPRKPARRPQILIDLAAGAIKPPELAAALLKRPSLWRAVFAALGEPEARLKFGCAKALHLLSPGHADLFLPYWDELCALLTHPNKIIQWTGLLILGDLAPVLSLAQVEELLPRVLSLLPGPVMITAANAMHCATQVALAHPACADHVAAQFRVVEHGRYKTAECRNIAVGHAIRMLDQLFPELQDQDETLRWVRAQLKNTRPATRAKVREFLEEHRRR